jgi:hypothetical protein
MIRHTRSWLTVQPSRCSALPTRRYPLPGNSSTSVSISSQGEDEGQRLPQRRRDPGSVFYGSPDPNYWQCKNAVFDRVVYGRDRELRQRVIRCGSRSRTRCMWCVVPAANDRSARHVSRSRQLSAAGGGRLTARWRQPRVRGQPGDCRCDRLDGSMRRRAATITIRCGP